MLMHSIFVYTQHKIVLSNITDIPTIRFLGGENVRYIRDMGYITNVGKGGKCWRNGRGPVDEWLIWGETGAIMHF